MIEKKNENKNIDDYMEDDDDEDLSDDEFDELEDNENMQYA
jgi:hypothetical protein